MAPFQLEVETPRFPKKRTTKPELFKILECKQLPGSKGLNTKLLPSAYNKFEIIPIKCTYSDSFPKVPNVKEKERPPINVPVADYTAFCSGHPDYSRIPYASIKPLTKFPYKRRVSRSMSRIRAKSYEKPINACGQRIMNPPPNNPVLVKPQGALQVNPHMKHPIVPSFKANTEVPVYKNPVRKSVKYEDHQAVDQSRSTTYSNDSYDEYTSTQDESFEYEKTSSEDPPNRNRSSYTKRRPDQYRYLMYDQPIRSSNVAEDYPRYGQYFHNRPLHRTAEKELRERMSVGPRYTTNKVPRNKRWTCPNIESVTPSFSNQGNYIHTPKTHSFAPDTYFVPPKFPNPVFATSPITNSAPAFNSPSYVPASSTLPPSVGTTYSPMRPTHATSPVVNTQPPIYPSTPHIAPPIPSSYNISSAIPNTPVVTQTYNTGQQIYSTSPIVRSAHPAVHLPLPTAPPLPPPPVVQPPQFSTPAASLMYNPAATQNLPYSVPPSVPYNTTARRSMAYNLTAAPTQTYSTPNTGIATNPVLAKSEPANVTPANIQSSPGVYTINYGYPQPYYPTSTQPYVSPNVIPSTYLSSQMMAPHYPYMPHGMPPAVTKTCNPSPFRPPITTSNNIQTPAVVQSKSSSTSYVTQSSPQNPSILQPSPHKSYHPAVSPLPIELGFGDTHPVLFPPPLVSFNRDNNQLKQEEINTKLKEDKLRLISMQLQKQLADLRKQLETGLGFQNSKIPLHLQNEYLRNKLRHLRVALQTFLNELPASDPKAKMMDEMLSLLSKAFDDYDLAKKEINKNKTFSSKPSFNSDVKKFVPEQVDSEMNHINLIVENTQRNLMQGADQFWILEYNVKNLVDDTIQKCIDASIQSDQFQEYDNIAEIFKQNVTQHLDKFRRIKNEFLTIQTDLDSLKKDGWDPANYCHKNCACRPRRQILQNDIISLMNRLREAGEQMRTVENQVVKLKLQNICEELCIANTGNIPVRPFMTNQIRKQYEYPIQRPLTDPANPVNMKITPNQITNEKASGNTKQRITETSSSISFQKLHENTSPPKQTNIQTFEENRVSTKAFHIDSKKKEDEKISDAKRQAKLDSLKQVLQQDLLNAELNLIELQTALTKKRIEQNVENTKFKSKMATQVAEGIVKMRQLLENIKDDFKLKDNAILTPRFSETILSTLYELIKEAKTLDLNANENKLLHEIYGQIQQLDSIMKNLENVTPTLL